MKVLTAVRRVEYPLPAPAPEVTHQREFATTANVWFDRKVRFLTL